MYLNRIVLVIMLTTIISCSKENDSETKPDFSVLGLERLLINEYELSLNSIGLPLNLTEIDNISLSSAEGYSAKSYTLTILNCSYKKVKVTSSFNDVTMEVNQVEENMKYSITISRNGFKEKVSYHLHFVAAKK